jgi:hypothetical protein
MAIVVDPHTARLNLNIAHSQRRFGEVHQHRFVTATRRNQAIGKLHRFYIAVDCYATNHIHGLFQCRMKPTRDGMTPSDNVIRNGSRAS